MKLSKIKSAVKNKVKGSAKKFVANLPSNTNRPPQPRYKPEMTKPKTLHSRFVKTTSKNKTA